MECNEFNVRSWHEPNAMTHDMKRRQCTLLIKRGKITMYITHETNAMYLNAMYFTAMYSNAMYLNAMYSNAMYLNAMYSNAMYLNAVYFNAMYSNAMYLNAMYSNAMYLNAMYSNAMYLNAMYFTHKLKRLHNAHSPRNATN